MQGQGSAKPPCKEQRLAQADLSGSEGSSYSSSAALLALLPSEVLLHVLRLAARPLSAWVNGGSDP